MNDRIDRQDSVVNRIIDGAITIDSVEEFEDLLKAFPNEPRLHRVFADRLLEEKSINAAEEYKTSARLFMEAGMPLQAITCKIFEWRIVKPSKEEGLAFHSALCESSPQNIEGQKFFNKLAYVEMIALMAKIVPHNYPANTKLKIFGDEENELCFVVSGALEQTNYHRLEANEKVQKKSATNLIEGDIFGEIYPFEEDKLSESDIESITRVELLKISKLKLTALCKEHPNLNLRMRNLFKSRSESNRERYLKTVRKATRHQLPMQVNLKIFQEASGKPPLNLSGFTDDISLGGTCVVLGAQYRTGDITHLTGKHVKIKMSLPVASISLNILGHIVWSKEIPVEGKKTAIIGVQFEEINPVDRGILKSYCCGSEAEQNLIWSLWNSLMEK
ncbi:MAG: PilZ domain-containing protein [Deltaproteobacteria bacterium]|nr:PilZ domain-containing protein [Deltaproteobacteria bacterium]